MVLLLGADGKPIKYSRQYTGEKIPGELSQWRYFGADPTAFISQTYQQIGDYSATLYHTSALARAAVHKPISYVIGQGVKFESHIPERFLGISADEALGWSRDFTELLELEKTSINYYEMTRQAMTEASILGDCLILFYRGDDGSIQDIVPEGGHAISIDNPDERTVLGVKLDEHARGIGVTRTNGDYLAFVDDDGRNAYLLKSQTRPGQPRGYPCLYSEIARLKNLDRWWDATLHRAVQEATIIGYSQTSTTDLGALASEMSRQAHGESEGDAEKKVNVASVPGFYELKRGENMQFIDNKTPANNFDIGNSWTVKMISAARGYPPEFIMGQYPTSFTAHKGALNDAKKQVDIEREIIKKFDKAVNLEYLKYFIRRGDLKIKGTLSDRLTRMAYLAGSYMGPTLGHINPSQEVTADIKAVEAGFQLPSQAAAKYGNNLNDFIDEWHRQNKLLEVNEGESE